MKFLTFALINFLLATMAFAEPRTELFIERDIPRPLDNHPGNVFLLGETVAIPLEGEDSHRFHSWRVLDDTLTEVSSGELLEQSRAGGRTEIGELEVGWYRIEFLGEQGNLASFTTAAVLEPLTEPVPQDSPICVDAALSWAEEDLKGRKEIASLGALAGVNWIRDRLRWREIEPASGEYTNETDYDLLAEYQTQLGMKVLQTFHGTPEWAAGPDGKRSQFPKDLRIAHGFCRDMAKRFQGSVHSWEPWNEANAHNFGGHTIDEMCSYQKACYLGFKEVDSALVVGWNPLGGKTIPSLGEAILRNETWPYYDTYNIHSYDWPHAFESLWGPSREAAKGKPIWVTEGDRGMKANPESPAGDFHHEDDIKKAQFLTHSYASSMAAGADAHFHFLLHQYMEQEASIQFGLLRPDKTPRLGYVALAALGRLLAGAEALGRLPVEGKEDAHIFAFRGRPHGEEKDILVAWVENPYDWPKKGNSELQWKWPSEVEVEAVYDYLGRGMESRPPDTLKSSPIFLILKSGETDNLGLVRREEIEPEEGEPSPVVLQLIMPEGHRFRRDENWTQSHERLLEPGTEHEFSVAVYNFGDRPIAGAIHLDRWPEDWKFRLTRWDISLEPGEREEIRIAVGLPAVCQESDNWLEFRGKFDEHPEAVLAFEVYTAKE